jgi:ribosome-associated translation inhibitor RaiA
MKAENFTEDILELNGVEVRVTTYKIGEEYHCHVYSADPGAAIARAHATQRERAIEEALQKAKKRLSKTSS